MKNYHNKNGEKNDTWKHEISNKQIKVKRSQKNNSYAFFSSFFKIHKYDLQKKAFNIFFSDCVCVTSLKCTSKKHNSRQQTINSEHKKILYKYLLQTWHSFYLFRAHSIQMLNNNQKNTRNLTMTDEKRNVYTIENSLCLLSAMAKKENFFCFILL